MGQRPAELDLQVTLEVRHDRLAVHRGIVVETHGHQGLAVIAGQLEPDRRIGAGLHQDPAHLVRVVGDAARLLALEGDPGEQVRDRPGVGDPGLGPEIVGQPPDLPQHHRLVEIAADADEEQGRGAPLSRSHPKTTGDGQAAEHDERGQGQERARRSRRRRLRRGGPGPARTEQEHEGRSARRRHGADRANAADGNEGERGRRAQGHGERLRHPSRAGAARERQARTRRGQEREEGPCDRQLDREEPPPLAWVRPERPLLEHVRRDRRQAETGGDQRGRDLGGDAGPVVGVDQESRPAAVLGQEPANRVGPADHALARRLPLGLARPARQHLPRAGLAARVHGDVEQSGRTEHRPHARQRGETLLGERQRLAVAGREHVVDLDGDLVQREQAEPVPRLPPAHDRGRLRRRPGERIARGARRPLAGHEPGERHPHRQSEAPGSHPAQVITRQGAGPGRGPEPSSPHFMKEAARATSTLRSASASDRMLPSMSSWYSWRRCVFSRYGPSVLMV